MTATSGRRQGQKNHARGHARRLPHVRLTFVTLVLVITSAAGPLLMMGTSAAASNSGVSTEWPPCAGQAAYGLPVCVSQPINGQLSGPGVVTEGKCPSTGGFPSGVWCSEPFTLTFAYSGPTPAGSTVSHEATGSEEYPGTISSPGYQLQYLALVSQGASTKDGGWCNAADTNSSVHCTSSTSDLFRLWGTKLGSATPSEEVCGSGAPVLNGEEVGGGQACTQIEIRWGASAPTVHRKGLVVSLKRASGSGPIDLGETVPMVERITAVGIAVHGVSGHLDFTGLKSSSGLDATSLTSGLSLAAGGSKSFSFSVTASTPGDGSIASSVTGTSSRGTESSSTKLALSVVATISGTVTHFGKPVAGVTVTARAAGETDMAVSTSDGSYQIKVASPGAWTVTPSGLNLTYTPAAHHVVIASTNSAHIDFTTGAAPTLMPEGNIVQDSGIEVHYGGTNWDPTGGPIAISLGGTNLGSEPAATSIRGKITVPYWPDRHTINGFTDPSGNACWGNLVATQGTSTATTEVGARGVGVVLWSVNANIHVGQVFCAGESSSALFAGGDIIVLNFTGYIDIYNGPGHVIRGISTSALLSGHQLCYSAPAANVHVTITLSKGNFHEVQATGTCPPS